MADREKKNGRGTYTNLNIFENEKSFSDEMKTFFVVFKELSFGEK